MQDLALKVTEIDDVKIDEADAANARGGQIEAQRRTETPGPNEKNAGRLEFLLPVHADFRHDEVAAVAGDFLGGKVHGITLRPRRPGCNYGRQSRSYWKG